MARNYTMDKGFDANSTELAEKLALLEYAKELRKKEIELIPYIREV